MAGALGLLGVVDGDVGVLGAAGGEDCCANTPEMKAMLVAKAKAIANIVPFIVFTSFIEIFIEQFLAGSTRSEMKNHYK